MTRPPTRVLVSGGVLAALIGLVGTVATGAFGYLSSNQGVSGKGYEAKLIAETEERKARTSLHQAICAGTLAYLQDETPNTKLSPGQQAIVEGAIARNMRECSPTGTTTPINLEPPA